MDSNETLNNVIKVSDDYVRGVIEGEGCFTFCSVGRAEAITKPRIPAFVLQMHERDLRLIEQVKEGIGLKNRIYIYRKPALATQRKIYRRGRLAMLIVRDVGQLKNKVVPFFYNQLAGYKGKQFVDWLEKIGTDSLVPERYKILYRLHKDGYWGRNSYFV